jgi:hypothetical protein
LSLLNSVPSGKTKISDNQAQQEITSKLQAILDYCIDIYFVMDIITTNEKLDETKSKEIYNALCKELFGSNNLGEDFDGTTTITSVYKAINTVRNMIVENYINNNPNKKDSGESLFITGTLDQINKTVSKLIDISKDLMQSTLIIDKNGIKKFEEILNQQMNEFTTKVHKAYT